MIAPELALTKTFLDIFVARDAYEAPSVVSDVASVLYALDEVEAEVMPAAYATAMRAVSSDATRWRSAADAAVQLDMFEVVPDLLDVLPTHREPHQLANVAILSMNPGVGDALRHRVEREIEGAASRTDANLQRQLLIRLGQLNPEGDGERVLHAQAWPGGYSTEQLSRLAPVVYVAELDAPRADMWRAIGALADSGVRVRRVPAEVQRLRRPEWANRAFPLVCWTGKAIAKWREMTGFAAVKSVLLTKTLEGNLALPRFLADVKHALPAHSRMRLGTQASPTITSAFSAANLKEGAFDAIEMTFLGAAGRSTLASLAKEALQPRDLDVHRWTFDQLITLRLVQSFKARKRTFTGDPRDLLSKVRDLALASERHVVALDANGQIYVEENGTYRTLQGNQEALSAVLTVDDAFRPFELGGGVLPDLLAPGLTTVVDPRVLGGTPTVRERRIPARGLTSILNQRGMEAVRSAFPELNPREISDALEVGRRIDAQRAA